MGAAPRGSGRTSAITSGHVSPRKSDAALYSPAAAIPGRGCRERRRRRPVRRDGLASKTGRLGSAHG
jgi:hypothetical protein